MKYKVTKLDLENLFSKKTSIKTIKVKTFFPCTFFFSFLIYRLAFGLISIIALLK